MNETASRVFITCLSSDETIAYDSEADTINSKLEGESLIRRRSFGQKLAIAFCLSTVLLYGIIMLVHHLTK